MSQWINNECSTTNFGDKRLKERYISILEHQSGMPSESIPASCGGWSETIATYRFLNNDRVTYNNVLEGHHSASKERISRSDIVLAIQDTTSIDYTNHRSSEKLGHLESSNNRGIFLHPTLAVTPSRVNLGVISTEIWTRDLSTIGKKYQRKITTIEDKESNRWLNSYRETNKLALEIPDTKFINIGDRESDFYELFVLATQEDSKAQLIVRAGQNRNVALGNNETSHLWSVLEDCEELGIKTLPVIQTVHHQSRNAKLSLKARQITLKAPYRNGNKLPNLQIYAVLAVEKNPPDIEDRIEWLLLTTTEVSNLSEAFEILDYYTCRWQIEMYFRILKGGCKIEKLQLSEPDTVMNAIAVYMVISWRIQYLLMLGRACPNLPSDLLFSMDEIHSIFVARDEPIPDKPPILNYMITSISALGGYLNRKCDQEPGVKVFWIGLTKLANYAFMYNKMTNRKDVYNR
jgi:hypothetical protein